MLQVLQIYMIHTYLKKLIYNQVNFCLNLQKLFST